ncbi:MAG: hypothetical protein ABNH38_01310 [Tateyamaria sp.]
MSQVSSLGIRAFQVTPKRAAKTSFSTQIVLKSQKSQFTPYTDRYKSLYGSTKFFEKCSKLVIFDLGDFFNTITHKENVGSPLGVTPQVDLAHCLNLRLRILFTELSQHQ